MIRYITIALAVFAWIALGCLIGFQTTRDPSPATWDLVVRYSVAAVAMVLTFMASKYTAHDPK